MARSIRRAAACERTLWCMAESFYETLGVPKDATSDKIRKAYRKLARKHHPDVNPGNAKAEEHFKKVAAAYEVLSDDKRRKAYDEFGDASLGTGFDPDKAREYSKWQNTRQRRNADFEHGATEFDFSELFGRARGPARGGDLHGVVQLDLRTAIDGTEVGFELPDHGTVRVRIPPGADTGSTIRIHGRGAPGANGGPPGDLVIETEVAPHKWLRRDDLDLSFELPVDLDEAYNGASVEIPTFNGSVVLKIPPRSQSGTKLRLRGKGVQRKDARGDLIVALDVRMPDRADDALAAALRAAKAAYAKPVREELVL